MDKQRRLDNNLEQAKVPPAKIEVGAVWSEKPEGAVTTAANREPAPAMHGGHFEVPVSSPAAAVAAHR